MDISKLQPIGKKIWTKSRWDEYWESKNTLAMIESEKAYYEPEDKLFDKDLNKGKWKATVDRKVNYLLARKPVVKDNQDLLDDMLPFIKETARLLILRGSLIWIVQGDGEEVNPRPLIMNNTIAIYSDEYKENVIAFIRKYAEIEIDNMTGEESKVDYYELYYKDDNEIWHRDTFNYVEGSNTDKEEVIGESLLFIELGKTGDAPLYAYIKGMLYALQKIFIHQDITVESNTNPLTEVRGYTGTSDADLQYAIQKLSIVKVDGSGGVTLHMRSMDSESIEQWTRRILNEYYEATSTVGKENEIAFAQSGKALDRLFVDMENSAKDLAATLEEALAIYFESIGLVDFDIVWNTDRPIDDAEIINGVLNSQGLLSNRTLLEQHPWVEDVEEEINRKTEEMISGMEDLYESTTEEENEWEDI